jgi:hypothetical protein
MRVDLKPVTRWIFARGYTVRFAERTPERVRGVLTTPAGEVTFVYDPRRRIVELPGERVMIDEYGWEINQTQ